MMFLLMSCRKCIRCRQVTQSCKGPSRSPDWKLTPARISPEVCKAAIRAKLFQRVELFAWDWCISNLTLWWILSIIKICYILKTFIVSKRNLAVLTNEFGKDFFMCLEKWFLKMRVLNFKLQKSWNFWN